MPSPSSLKWASPEEVRPTPCVVFVSDSVPSDTPTDQFCFICLARAGRVGPRAPGLPPFCFVGPWIGLVRASSGPVSCASSFHKVRIESKFSRKERKAVAGNEEEIAGTPLSLTTGGGRTGGWSGVCPWLRGRCDLSGGPPLRNFD